MYVPASVIADEGLYVGYALTDEAYQHLKEIIAKASAKERALRIIAATDISKNELKHRLVEKGETPQNAEAAIAWLTELNLLDDARVAAQIVSRGVGHGYGKKRIEQMLYEKRIPKEYWEEALSEIPAMDEQIDRFLQTKLCGTQTADRKQIDRAIAALMRRGHSWHDIQAALERYRANND